MTPKSLSSRLLWVTLLALAPSVFLAISSVVTLHRDRTNSLHTEARRNAELISLELEQIIMGAESVLRTVATAPIVKRSSSADCTLMLQEVAGELAFLAVIAIVDPKGQVVCASTSRSWTADIQANPGLVSGTGSGDRVVGQAVWDPEAGKLRLPISVPIGPAEGSSQRVAIGLIDLDWLERRLLDRTLPPQGSLTVADSAGTILARVPEPERFVGTTIPDAFIRLVQAKVPGSEEVISQDGTTRILGYSPPAANPSGLYVSTGISVQEGYATLRTVASRAVAIIILGTALASMAAFYTARVFIARPVKRVIDTIAAWRDGDAAARTMMKSADGEICSAGHSLDAFMDELVANREARRKSEEARDLMRNEIEHREKNLLATVQAIARQTFRNPDDLTALKTFSSRLNTISEANRMLKQSDWEDTPLSGLVQGTLATFVADGAAQVKVSGPDLMVKGNVATAIAMALHELCTNAVKYGALSTEHGLVEITWCIGQKNGGEVFSLIWSEKAGPVVQPPGKIGFGSKVIRQALSAQTGGTVEVDYAPTGLVCRFSAPAAAIVSAADAETVGTPT